MSSTAGSSQDDFLSNYGDVLYQFASHNERPADTPADTIERCVTETSDGKYVVETYNKSDFLQRILNIFKSRVDDLKPLKGMFEQILAKMQNSPELKAKYGSLVSRALQGMRRLYEQYRHDTSAEAAIKRNDILECLSVAIRPKGFNELIFQQLSSTGRIHGAQRLNACSERVRKSAFLIERIKALPLKQAQEVSEKSILYVCYKDLEKALTRLRAINNDNPSVEEIQRVLKETLHKEDVPFGAVIEALYAHRLDHETLNRLVTALQTLRFGKIDTPTTSEKFFQLFFTILSGRTSQLIHKDTITSVGKLVEFFQNLHISVETEYQGELYGYSEIFTGDLRDPKSHNEAFERGLTQEARQMFLQEAQRRQAQIQKETGTRSPVIISNSFNRLRFHELNEGEVAKRFNIVGKLLDFSEENMRATEEEQTHTGQFQFSLKEMLGVEGEVQNKDVVAAKDLQSDQAARLVLRSCASLVDREKVNMVIQRLAPQDIHHFYSSAKGRVLSRKECCEVLQKELGKRNPDDPEARQLQELINYYKNLPEASDHSTINIEGTQRSVSTIALRYRPAILAQNDRKIMMVQHEDGTLAIHTFIGATGVNQVRVTAVAQETLQSSGLDYGSMGFGSEDKSVGWLRKKPEGWHKGLIDRIKNFFFGKSNIPVASKTSSEQSSSIHLTPDRVKNIGDEAGTFAMGGSTVVSLYFKKDFVPTGQLSEWNQRANFTSTTARVNNHVQGAPVPPHIRQLEVRCNFGDPVAIPVGHAALKLFQDVLKKGFTHLIGRGATVNDLIARFIERAPESHLAPHEEALKKTYLAIFQKMEKSEPLSRYEEGVYTRLLEALQHQIRKHRVRRS